MITAGRILHHVFNSVADKNNTILIVGYCARHTIGAQLAQGKEFIHLFGQHLPVLAEVVRMNSFSAHGDQSEMIDFLRLQDRKRVRQLFLVHGDPHRQQAFAKKLNEEGFDNVVIPHLSESFKL